MLVTKADGSWRFFIYFRRLNAITIRDPYPIYLMEDDIDSLGEAKIFTILDANCGYWQVPIHASGKDKTTFTFQSGTYQFKRMPFGQINAPNTFQRTLDILISGLRRNKCLVNIDDVIILNKSFEEHLKQIHYILKVVQDAGSR